MSRYRKPGPQTSYLLRKLHSLSGIVPLGAFLAEHFLVQQLRVGERPKNIMKTSQELQTIPFSCARGMGFYLLADSVSMAAMEFTSGCVVNRILCNIRG